MELVAREDREEGVVDRELHEPRDVLAVRRVVVATGRGAEGVRHVRTRELAASASVLLASSREGIGGSAQGRLVVRLVHGAPCVGCGLPLGIGQGERPLHEVPHGRSKRRLGAGRGFLTPGVNGGSIGRARWG